jgi:anti-sigma factor (TIGR02949 family)
MITCREAVEQLWAYIDGELENTDVNSVEEHLEACKGCYPHYDFQKAFREFVRRHGDKAVPADLRKRIFLRLLAEDRRESADSPGAGEDARAFD